MNRVLFLKELYLFFTRFLHSFPESRPLVTPNKDTANKHNMTGLGVRIDPLKGFICVREVDYNPGVIDWCAKSESSPPQFLDYPTISSSKLLGIKTRCCEVTAQFSSSALLPLSRRLSSKSLPVGH